VQALAHCFESIGKSKAVWQHALSEKLAVYDVTTCATNTLAAVNAVSSRS
jgi:hypothetical protein